METMSKAIVSVDAYTGTDFSAALGCAVGADGALGGNFGVVVEVDVGDDSGSVAVFGGNAGPVEVKLAGTVTKGALLVKSNSTGKFTAAAATDVANAVALEAGVADELISAVLLPPNPVGAEVYAAYVAGT